MIKTKAAFLESRLLSSQSEQSKKFSKILDWLEKSPALQKSHFCFDHVNRLIKCNNYLVSMYIPFWLSHNLVYLFYLCPYG